MTILVTTFGMIYLIPPSVTQLLKDMLVYLVIFDSVCSLCLFIKTLIFVESHQEIQPSRVHFFCLPLEF